MINKKTLLAAATCAMVFAAGTVLPGGASLVDSAYARGNGGGGGGGGAGGGGGHGGGHGGGFGGGYGGGHAGSHDGKGNGYGRDGGHTGKGNSYGRDADHTGKATRNGEDKGNRYGSLRNDDNGHGYATSAVARDKDSRGLANARAVADTTPGDHNSDGLGKAGVSSSKNDSKNDR
ncbi:hypothetical protein ACFPU0_03910 [Pseudomonas sp. GCM10022186]|uniref:hypothetical protein n=1 Tax=Pseudomonas sp. GCM10022186 TaxID=3252650 RepID=UPI003620D269